MQSEAKRRYRQSDKWKAVQHRAYIRRRDERLHEQGLDLQRTCRICHETKEITAFRIQALGVRGRSTACKRCLNIPQAAYLRRKRAHRWAYELVHHAKARAKIKGSPFNLTEEWILAQYERQCSVCYWLCIPLHLYGLPYHPLRPTLDRLDPTKGYTTDNVVVASRFANTGRGVCSFEETVAIMQHIRDQKQMPDPGLVSENGGDR